MTIYVQKIQQCSYYKHNYSSFYSFSNRNNCYRVISGNLQLVFFLCDNTSKVYPFQTTEQIFKVKLEMIVWLKRYFEIISLRLVRLVILLTFLKIFNMIILFSMWSIVCDCFINCILRFCYFILSPSAFEFYVF